MPGSQQSSLSSILDRIIPGRDPAYNLSRTWAEVRPGFSAAIDRAACSGPSALVSWKGGEPL